MFVNVVNAREAGGTELSNGIATDIECSLSGTSSGRNPVDRGSGICLLLFGPEAVVAAPIKVGVSGKTVCITPGAVSPLPASFAFGGAALDPPG